MKKSDKKQIDNAWRKFHEGMDRFMTALADIQTLSDSEFSVDDLNQLTSRVDKISATLERIKETHVDYSNRDIEEEDYTESISIFGG
jgi:hypothetical protein